ncbi:prepilin-type N-terminal cleavage/methylation domain-containing protein [Paenibacillus sp. 5J-6]|uniref:Prepilin-type N-terminal cleavage/methylation domain-containing protein n=1 Tax=Paenibacillus silvestris TaxID=2606219 RepID=A0A6L8VAN6_9BACL|nr:type II secretion system protein [Paenibacillus silvestris]MZQ87343.1 prepilin-type N-terminal cleavage/methylation domain-containing protein [Paenibacillus silvestris]
MKLLNQLRKDEKGFTLIELLAVIVILAVIAAIAVPYILGIVDKSKENSDVAMFHQVYEASRLYVAAEKNGTAPDLVKVKTELVTAKYLESGIVLPSTKKAISAGKVEYTNGVLTKVTLSTEDGTYTLGSADVIASTGKKAKAAAGEEYTSE